MTLNEIVQFLQSEVGPNWLKITLTSANLIAVCILAKAVGKLVIEMRNLAIEMRNQAKSYEKWRRELADIKRKMDDRDTELWM